MIAAIARPWTPQLRIRVIPPGAPCLSKAPQTRLLPSPPRRVSLFFRRRALLPQLPESTETPPPLLVNPYRQPRHRPRPSFAPSTSAMNWSRIFSWYATSLWTSPTRTSQTPWIASSVTSRCKQLTTTTMHRSSVQNSAQPTTHGGNRASHTNPRSMPPLFCGWGETSHLPSMASTTKSPDLWSSQSPPRQYWNQKWPALWWCNRSHRISKPLFSVPPSLSGAVLAWTRMLDNRQRF